MAQIGQGIFLKLDFADGEKCNYSRPFLIINKVDDKLHLLNISSLDRKEWKLGIPSNKNISRFNPPFLKRSFVKLDALYIVPDDEFIEEKLLCQKRRINPLELRDIVSHHNNFREENQVNVVEYLLDEVKDMNSDLVAI